MPREVLIRTVWGDTVVTDDALQRCISVLRKTLGRGEHGVWIETIPKVGYRLVVPATTDPAPSAPGHRRWIALGFGGAVLLAGIVSAMWPSDPDRPALAIRPLTSQPGHEISPSVSRDGSHVAFIRKNAGGRDLFVMVDGAPALRLTDTDANEHAPAYAPDGTQIAFARTDNGRCAVFTVAPTGGPVRKRFDCAFAATTELAWAPDGRHLAYLDRPRPGAPVAARILDLETSRHFGPDAPTRGLGDGDLAFSPDGATLAFTRSPALGVEDVFLYERSSRRTRRLTRDTIKVHGLDFIDADTLVISSNRAGAFGLWRLGLDGTIARLPAVGRHHDAPSAAPTAIVYEAYSARVDLFIAALAPGPKTAAHRDWAFDAATAPAIASTHFDWSPAVSADGKVAFVSDRSGSAEVWVAEPSSDTVMRLTSFEGPYVQRPQWSPDAETIVFAAPVDGNFDLYRVAAAGGPAERLTESNARDRTPSFSADGAALYFASDRTGEFFVWRLDIESGERRALFRGYAPREIDGWLYYGYARRNGLYRRQRDGRRWGPEQVVVPELTPVDATNWVAVDGSVVFVERPMPSKPRLVRLDISSGTRHVLTALPRFYHRSGLAVAPDGALWLARVVSSETDLYRIDLNTASW